METLELTKNIESIKEGLGESPYVIIKEFYIGKDRPLDAAIIYVNSLASKDIIDRDILSPLMLYVNENLTGKLDLANYISKRYISMSNTYIETELDKIVNLIKRGKTALLINGMCEAIIIDTTSGNYRPVSEPINETTIKGSREGFVENLETNISIIRRNVKDNNLSIDISTIGKKSQTDIALVYINNLADEDVLSELKKRIEAIDVDGPVYSGELEQFIEAETYTVFPQSLATERSDIAISNMMEGRIIILVEGNSVAIIVPVIFTQFFQAVEDYTQRTVVASFVRLLRFFAAFMVISTPAIYLTLLKFNPELIPIKFITPIIQSRTGIALTPFLEILAMELVVEFLREGGLRLPSKIAQTLSLVGGIIIGDTAIKSKIVSPTTLLIVGLTVIVTFLIPNYDMSLAIRILRFPMLLLADILGIFGIAIGWFLILVHLASMDSLGVPYLDIGKKDLKDVFIRAPLWKMNERPEAIPSKNPIRQTDFRYKWRKDKDGEEGEESSNK